MEGSPVVHASWVMTFIWLIQHFILPFVNTSWLFDSSAWQTRNPYVLNANRRAICKMALSREEMCEETANKSGLIKLCRTIMTAMSIQQLELFKNYKIMGEWRHVSRYLLWKLAKFPSLRGRCLYLANCQMWSESKLRLKNQVVSIYFRMWKCASVLQTVPLSQQLLRYGNVE